MNDTEIFPNSPQRNMYGPVTPGQLFERTFALLRENPTLFFGIVLVVIGVEIVVGGVLRGSGMWLGRYGGGSSPILGAIFVVPLALLGAAIIYIVTQIIQGALFLATRAKLGNAYMTVGEACRLAADKAGRLVGISILVGLRIIGYMLLLDIVAGVLVMIALAASGVRHSFAQNPFQAGHGAALALGIVLGLFLLAIAVVYIALMFWVVLRYAVAIPASLEENLPITDAIRRSIVLTRGSKGRLVAVFVAVACVWIAMAVLTVPLQMMAAHAGAGHGGGFILAAAAIRILFSWILIAFMGVATAVCYFDLRVRKEGFGAPTAVPVLEIPSAATAPPPDWPIEDLPVS